MTSQIRIVGKQGKLSFRWVGVDDEGNAEKILDAEVNFGFNNMEELDHLIQALKDARGKPIVHSNACNERLMKE